MMRKEVIAAALVALASVSGFAARSEMTAGSTAPCAPELDTPGLPRPAPPDGLRILSKLMSLFHLETALEAASGTLAATAGDPGPHSYFDALSLRSDCMVAYSLRDAAQLQEYARSRSRPLDITYDPASDPDPRRQDAAKVVVPADEVSLPNQVQLPIPPVGGDSLLVTWDAWWGKEFAYNNTTIGNYKAFQLASPAGRIWTEVKSDFNRALAFPGAVATVNVRSYGKLGVTLGPNVTAVQPLSPEAGQFVMYPETWTRYWAFFKPAGEWFEFSLWVADEGHNAVQIIDRRQLKPNIEGGATGWESFWIEFNTSSIGLPEGRGPLVAYARNVVMLRGVSDATTLLQRPLK